MDDKLSFWDWIHMKIFRNVQSESKKIQEKDDQIKYYDTQSAALRVLKVQPWYKYIIDYLEYQANSAMNKLWNPETPDHLIKSLQGEYQAAIKMIRFLDNVTAK